MDFGLDAHKAKSTSNKITSNNNEQSSNKKRKLPQDWNQNDTTKENDNETTTTRTATTIIHPDMFNKYTKPKEPAVHPMFTKFKNTMDQQYTKLEKRIESFHPAQNQIKTETHPKPATYQSRVAPIRDMAERKAQRKPVSRNITTNSPREKVPIKQSMSTSDNAKSKKRLGVALSEEQEAVLELIINGRENVFFTGSAGTGKSTLMREVIRQLKDINSSDTIAITATTGIAASTIGGCTLHAFAGCGLADAAVDVLVTRLQKNKKSIARWLKTRVLIIDEISMCDAVLFDKLEHVARRIRGSLKPFGGIQVIATGDFFQLPPVATTRLAFEAASWNSTMQRMVVLNKVFRQRDQSFVDILNQMRCANLSQQSIAALNKLDRAVKYEAGEEPTELYPVRAQVDAANSKRLAKLDTEECVFEAEDYANPSQASAGKWALEKLAKDCICPSRLTLKIGAQVILLKNISENLVNGSLGTVERFDEVPAGVPKGINEFGSMTVTKKVERLPVVVFRGLDGSKLPAMICYRQKWSSEVNGEILASRDQVPLNLAWALSIHKSQGQTISRVKVDLAKIFESGQAYVALSRAQKMESLQVLNFDISKVRADPKVAEFYRKLERLGSQHGANHSALVAHETAQRQESEGVGWVSKDKSKYLASS